MKYTLPENIRTLVPYEPVDAQYEVRLDANESFLQPPVSIIQEFQQALLSVDFNRYPDASATKLCEAFGTYYGVDPRFVVAFDGSDEVLALMSATFYRGGTLGVFSDDFSMYRQYAQTYGADCVTLSKEADLTISVDRLLKQMEEQHVTALLFSNPCNPTSLGLSRKEVLRLLESTDALIILDEAYMDFWDLRESLLDCVEQYDNLIVLKTCSKAMGMASVRLGFAVSKSFAKVYRAVKSPYNVNSVSQLLGTIMLNHPDWLQTAAKTLIASRQSLQIEMDRLAKQYPSILPVVYPSCTNFIYVQTPYAEEIYQKLQKRSISIRKMKGHLRITAGSPEENQKVLAALRDILEEQNG